MLKRQQRKLKQSTKLICWLQPMPRSRCWRKQRKRPKKLRNNRSFRMKPTRRKMKLEKKPKRKKMPKRGRDFSLKQRNKSKLQSRLPWTRPSPRPTPRQNKRKHKELKKKRKIDSSKKRQLPSFSLLKKLLLRRPPKKPTRSTRLKWRQDFRLKSKPEQLFSRDTRLNSRNKLLMHLKSKRPHLKRNKRKRLKREQRRKPKLTKQLLRPLPNSKRNRKPPRLRGRKLRRMRRLPPSLKSLRPRN